MLERLESPPNVIAIKAVGKLAKDDYTNVLTPAIKALMDSTGELRAVIVVGVRRHHPGWYLGGPEDRHAAPHEVEAVRGRERQGLGEARRCALRVDDAG